jgi:DNA-binding winged helix-turn-helix (wHTH) protein
MDLESEELKKNGHILKLRSQPFRMLAIIAERNGDVITREELRAQLWPAATFGDYKHSLGNSLLEIRKVLHDSANNPEYVETVSRGYRFLKPVEFIIGSSANGNGSSHCHSVSLLI